MTGFALRAPWYVRERAHTGVLDPAVLRPAIQMYDDPEFIVRNLWRLYGGWYDGNPAHLKPAREQALAAELAGLAGDADVLARRAVELSASGEDADLRLAGHLAEYAAMAAPDSATAHRTRAEVFARRRDAEPSLMAKGVFSWAEAESLRQAEA